MPLSFSQVAARWPKTIPLVALLGRGRFSFVATALSEVAFDDFCAERLPSNATLAAGRISPLHTGWMGVLSYDELKELALRPLTRSITHDARRFALGPTTASRIYRVHQVLVFDSLAGQWQLGPVQQDVTPQYALSAGDLEKILAPADKVRLIEAPGIPLAPMTCDETYRHMAAAAIEEIRSGRYYQINLLRYFRLALRPKREWLLTRLARLAEGFGCYIETSDFTLASFSPERFVRLKPLDDAYLLAETEPIKGTAARVLDDPTRDHEAALALMNSRKDTAELHMIVDLMRNDLNRIAERGSVNVSEATRLTSHAQVHHLSAKIEARLAAGLEMREFLAALCPAGSITGAPKREVMQAIEAAEGRQRGFFMGNAFYLDDSGHFDSSVLIRTLVCQKDACEYAAGSGLTINSDPIQEEAEIRAKARVIEAES